jgi:hypothetical protein
LFGTEETDLKPILRSPGFSIDSLYDAMSSAVFGKKKSHGGMFEIQKNQSLNRPMIKIGG